MEPKTTKRPSRKLVVFKRELPFYLMLIIFFPLPLTLPIPTFYFLIPNCSNFSPCFLTPNFSRRFPMAHTLLFSGYGAPGCDDLAVCRLTADGMLDCVYELDGHMRVLNHDGLHRFHCAGQHCAQAAQLAGWCLRHGGWHPVCQQPRAQHHLGVAAQRPDPPFPLRMAHRRLAAGAVRGAGHPVSVGCLPTRGRGALLRLFTLAPPRPYRNRQPCAAWCFLRAGAGLIFVIVFSLFLIFYLFKLFFSVQ